MNKFAFPHLKVPQVGCSQSGMKIFLMERLFVSIVTLLLLNLLSLISGNHFHLTNVYGPLTPVEKSSFVHRLYSFDVSSFVEWALVGDFNFIRGPGKKKKHEGSVNDMFLFNDVIQHLDLIEVPSEGNHYTWSNMQDVPLLEKIDWSFTLASWSLTFPATKVQTLAHPVSDHVQYTHFINTVILKSSQLRFENYWTEFICWFL